MRVSVIIPVYNAENYIAECLESVLQQTWKDIEIIVVDNNSEDASLSILQKYSELNPKKIKLLSTKKQGASCARNAGLYLAKGDWIQFLDADDLILNDKIEHQVKLINLNSCFIAGSSIYNSEKEQFIYPLEDNIKGLFTMLGTGNTCANLWNKKSLLQVNGFNESLADTEDPDLMFRLWKKNKNIINDFVPKTIIRNINPDSLSKRDLKGSYQRHLELRQRILDYLIVNELNYFRQEKDFFVNMMYKYVRLLAVQDLSLGVEAYHKYLPINFKPSYKKDINTPLWNIIAMKFLSFHKTESWKNKLLNRS
jgi:glycosyltransferase involved in cell wall biosynthesis